MHELIVTIINIFVPVLESVGVTLIIWGSLIAIFRLIRIELKNNFNDKLIPWERVRVNFGQKMVLGLEFFLAADIISTIAAPSNEALIQLGSIVIIRTILSYFLVQEVVRHKGKEL